MNLFGKSIIYSICIFLLTMLIGSLLFTPWSVMMGKHGAGGISRIGLLILVAAVYSCPILILNTFPVYVLLRVKPVLINAIFLSAAWNILMFVFLLKIFFPMVNGGPIQDNDVWNCDMPPYAICNLILLIVFTRDLKISSTTSENSDDKN